MLFQKHNNKNLRERETIVKRLEMSANGNSSLILKSTSKYSFFSFWLRGCLWFGVGPPH